MSSSRAGPVPSRTGVRSMITVTYLSPRRVCRHTCSSTPTTFTPSKRCGSSISTRLPSARTASLAVSQATPSPSATRATVRCWTTIPSSAHRSAARETASPAARPPRWCPGATHARSRCTGNGARRPPASWAASPAVRAPSRRTTVSRGLAFAAAAPAPLVRLDHPARQYGTIRLESLPGDLEAEFVEAAEGGQVRAAKHQRARRR